MAVLAARAAADKQANDVRVLQVRDLIAITDFFVICSGNTDRQVKAIGEAIEEALRAEAVKPMRREGERDMHWLLLDFADVVVHVFQEEDRRYYELERLWKDAPLIEWDAADQASRVRH
ncbi:MAG TPA: ribosome silencing factor [Actinomycetota bacterium]